MKLAIVSVLALTVGATGCGGSTGPGGGTPPPPPPPPPPPASFTFTFTDRSLDPTGAAGLVYAFIGDVTETRARMPAILNENAPIMIPIPGQASRTVTLNVPSGKTVTLFAVELGRAGSNGGRPQTPLVARAPDDATEFVNFEGPVLVAGEPGVVSFRMDGDKSVTANFDRMKGFKVTFTGCQESQVGWKGPPYLGFGALLPDSAGTGFDGLMLSATPFDVRYPWGKQGTIVTIKVRPPDLRTPTRAEAGLMSWGGAASGCGSNLTCDTSIPAVSTPVTALLNASYVLDKATGIPGCGFCEGTTCPDFISRMRP